MLQSGIKAWFTPWTRLAECVCHSYMLVPYVLFMFVEYVLVCMHGSGNFFCCVTMWKLMMLLLGCIGHEFMLLVYSFVMHVKVYIVMLSLLRL